MLKQFKQQYIRYFLSFLVLAALLLNTAGLIHLPFIQSLENKAYDLRLNWLMPNTVDDKVVIVDIDEKSLAALGRWPWSRNQLATMVDQLFDDYQIDTLGFDVVFAEKDNSAGYQTLLDLKETHLKDNQAYAKTVDLIQTELDYDQLFADSFRDRKVVMGYYFTHHQNEQAGQLPPAVKQPERFKPELLIFNEYEGYGANLSKLQKSAYAGGHFNPIVDDDGITRRISMLSKFKDQLYPSLSLAVAQAVLGAKTVDANYGKNLSNKKASLEWLEVAGHKIPVNENLSSLIPYRGKQNSFQYVSASDVIAKKVDKQALLGKIVLLGTTAPGLLDLRATPVQSVYPGVETHANMIAGILDGNIKHQPDFMQGAEFVLLLLLGIVLIIKMPKLSPAVAGTLAVGLLLATILLNLGLWQFANIVMPIASSILLIAALYLFDMSFGYFVESKSKRQLGQLFGQYVPKGLVDEMVDSPESISLSGQSKELTVLFSDVRGFTTISEGMEPSELTALMNDLLSPLTQVIHEHRGTIDKYMGDAIMAFWGAPLSNAQHAEHAIAAALAMQERIKDINKSFAEKKWPTIEIGVGLSTGLMTVGNMGSNFRMTYTVMGDAVNLGARLESLTKTYGVPIIVSEKTKQAAPQYLYRELDTVTVKGKTEAVRIYQPLCLMESAPKALKDEVDLHHVALQHYYAKNWDLAEMQWLNLKESAILSYEFFLIRKNS